MSSPSKPVTVVITCAIRPEKLIMAKRALNNVIKTVISIEKACKGIQVHQDPDHPQRLLIIERWDSKEIFLGAHMQTHHMIAFLKLAKSFLDGEAVFNFWNEMPLPS